MAKISEQKPTNIAVELLDKQAKTHRAGELELYDIYQNEVWCGSRRTEAQCAKVMET